MKNQRQQGIGRREFILITSGTALAAMAMGQTALRTSSASGDAARRYALGFIDLDSVAETGGRFVSNAASAARISSSDGQFIRYGVRLAVRGYNVEPKSANAQNSIQLIVNYSSNDGHVYPYSAWSYTKKSGGGSPVSFTVPFDGTQSVRLLFVTDLAVAAAAMQKPSPTLSRRDVLSMTSMENGDEPDAVRLTMLSDSAVPKLRRGFYVLTPVGGAIAEPDWSSLQLRRTEGGYKLFTSADEEAHFEYLVLLADYAAPTPDETSKPGRKTN